MATLNTSAETTTSTADSTTQKEANITTLAATVQGHGGPLQLGVVTVLDRDTNELIGYAFTEISGKGQYQRWILYRHPQNAMAIAGPPEEMARWTLADWKAALPRLWRPGSYYVRAQADLYAYDANQWSKIPENQEALPAPTYPKGDNDAQFDPTGRNLVWKAGDERVLGMLKACGKLDDDSNAEYWLLLPNYVPAGVPAVGAPAGTHMASVMSTEDAPDLNAFLGVANRYWGPGATFVITGCMNYRDVAGKGTLPPEGCR